MIYDEIFTWDEIKNRKNMIKHRVNFQEAASVFKDEVAVVLNDSKHSHDEERFVIIGISKHKRLLMVCHCYRGNDDLIRIISARKADDEEQLIYENGGVF